MCDVLGRDAGLLRELRKPTKGPPPPLIHFTGGDEALVPGRWTGAKRGDTPGTARGERVVEMAAPLLGALVPGPRVNGVRSDASQQKLGGRESSPLLRHAQGDPEMNHRQRHVDDSFVR